MQKRRHFRQTASLEERLADKAARLPDFGGPAIPQTELIYYRAQAADAKAHAVRASNEVDREAWMKLSVQWTTLAGSIEVRIRRRP
jgi:hypothetical protein